MRRWYEPRRDRPDLERSAIRKRGFVGYMDMLWREFFELLKLNLLFVLSCVPIITIPAALTAMHRITSVMVRDENHFLWPDYWKAFRRDFWKSLGGGAAIAPLRETVSRVTDLELKDIGTLIPGDVETPWLFARAAGCGL